MHNSAAPTHIRMMRETSDGCFSVCPPLISRPGLVLHHHCPAPPHCHNPGILLIPRPIPCPHHRGTDERVGFVQRCHRSVCLCAEEEDPTHLLPLPFSTWSGGLASSWFGCIKLSFGCLCHRQALICQVRIWGTERRQRSTSRLA